MDSDQLWWENAVFYQIYPLSFADSDGDGHGDIEGIIGRLDYLSETLKVDAIWLSPVYKSPMRDWGYDVADHTDIDALFGDIDAAERLISAVHERGMRIIFDYVMNHTSDEHEWFVNSRAGRDSPRRDWYVWRDPKPDGSEPSNWVSVFSGPAWTFDEISGQYYRHTYHWSQPDLNWRNREVVDAMKSVVRFWLDRGVDGFRIDGARQMMKDPLERDNPPVPQGYVNPYKDMGEYGKFLHLHDHGHPDVHSLHREMRTLLDSYPGNRTSIGEVHEFDLTEWATYYGSGLDEFHMPFNFHLMVSEWTADDLREVIENVLQVVPKDAPKNWTLGNHDERRIASRLGSDNARLAPLLLLTLPGATFIYYGDELGMANGEIGAEEFRDPWGANIGYLGRDGCRTPMQWSSGVGAGFSMGSPWLPIADGYQTINVDIELEDPTSMLNLYRRLLAIRIGSEALRQGTYRRHPASDSSILAYQRIHGNETMTVLLNLSDMETRVDGVIGEIKLTTATRGNRHDRDSLILAPREGVILKSG